MPNQFLSPEGDLEEYFVDEYWLIDQYVGDTLWLWGRNNYGQLGVNDVDGRLFPVTIFGGGANWKQVSCGYHTAAIKTDGTLWTWGYNSYGQLGINVFGDERITPVVVSSGATNWKQVACGDEHTAAIKTDGTLWTWGKNGYAQLGINLLGGNHRATPVTTFLGGNNWKQVSCGFGHTAAIKTDGTLWCWGNNFYGQLGVNDTNPRCTPVQEFNSATDWKQVSCGFYHTTAIKTDGTLWSWGLNSEGQLGDITTNQKRTPVQTFFTTTNWKQVSGGQYHTAAIKTDGTLWNWGRNNEGQLGIGSFGSVNNKNTPVQTSFAATNWKQVSCGLYHTAAIKKDGTLWSWGRNDFGQVGNNSPSTSVSIPTQTTLNGTNWKQVSGALQTAAVTSGTDPTHFIS